MFDLAGIVFNLHVSELATHFSQILHCGIPIYDLSAAFLIIWSGIENELNLCISTNTHKKDEILCG